MEYSLPYNQKDTNIIQTILNENFTDFENSYDEKYANEYGLFRLDRINETVSKFAECGDWHNGIARVKCTNADCKYEMFLPFSCKQWYLCPSCHQKRIQLLSEHLSEEVMLRLPHRQFVFTIPKLLRPYFKNDRKLFSGISKLIHKLISDFYIEASGKVLTTGTLISHQTYGDMLRFNPHWHCLILEGGLDEKNNFISVAVKDTANLAEAFRRAVVQFFVTKELLNKDFAQQFLNWKHSGFSVDNSVFLSANDEKGRESLCQYITRHPVSLKKITYEPFKKKVLYHTKYNEYFKENIKLFSATDFIADLTIHIPPKGKHLIRYYGLYASRTKGKARQDGRFEKYGIGLINNSDVNNQGIVVENEANSKSSKQAWAKLIQKVYEVDPLKCPKCESSMKVIAIIQDKVEIVKIIACLEKKNRAPP